MRKYVITDIIQSLITSFRIIRPGKYGKTIRNFKIFTIFDRLDPVIKIEEEKAVMDLFGRSFEEEQSNYNQKHY